MDLPKRVGPRRNAWPGARQRRITACRRVFIVYRSPQRRIAACDALQLAVGDAGPLADTVCFPFFFADLCIATGCPKRQPPLYCA